ncbi:MAG TPA: type II CAAX endopeptidase family protein [Clostridia bacterium]|nr:type II CAAX endopeptidase family protein [Clostridia bacterium]
MDNLDQQMEQPGGTGKWQGKLTLTGANILFFIFTVIFLVYQFVIGIIMGTAIYDKIYLIVLINELIIVASVLIYCFIKRINILKTFRFNRIKALPALIILFAAVPASYAASMFNTIVIYLLQSIGNVPNPGIPTPKNIPELLMGILIIAVAPGICEEIMHRGLLLRAYEKRGSYKAVVFVAILFGLFHFDMTNFIGPVLLGLLIGYYVVRTNSILAGMLAHFLNNAFAEFVQYLNKEPQKDTITISGTDLVQSIIYGIIGLAVVAVLLYLFRLATRSTVKTVPPISRTGQDVKAFLTHWPIILVIVFYFIMAAFYILTIVLTKYLDL